MMISFCCQQCSREYKVDDKYAGRKVRCKQCNHYNVIPIAKQPAEKKQPVETISFACDSCGQKLRVKRIYVGKRVKCSSCGEPCTIPHPQIQAIADQASESPAIEKTPPAAPPAKKVSFNCIMCSARMQADESQAGEVIECPKCQCYVEVPGKPKETPAEEESSCEDWENRSAPEEDYMPVNTGISSPRPARKKSSMPAAWKIPAAIATSFAFTIAGAIAWAVIAAITGFQFSLIIIAVGGLAGVGLTLFTDKRSVILGIVAVLIGLFGMFIGKVLIVKFAIMPSYKNDAASVTEQDVNFLDFSPKSKYALCISSCLEKRDDGELDRQLAWPVFGMFLQAKIMTMPEGAELDDQLKYWILPISGIDENIIVDRMKDIRNGVKAVSDYMATLSDKQKKDIIASHKDEIIESYVKMASSNPAVFAAEFMSSFRPFDIIFILVGLFTAFNVGTGRNT